jgi:hypothetical protein
MFWLPDPRDSSCLATDAPDSSSLSIFSRFFVISEGRFLVSWIRPARDFPSSWRVRSWFFTWEGRGFREWRLSLSFRMVSE